MRILQILKQATLFLMLTLFSATTYASTVTYIISFDGSQIGPAGTGAFVWNDESLSMSSFTWEFGTEIQGGINDSLLGAEFFTGTFGQALFETLTGQDVHQNFDPIFVLGHLGGLDGTFPNGEIEFGGVDSVNASLSYELRSDNPINPDYVVVARGMYSVTPIPLPGALVLMISALGLLGASASRK